MERLPPEFLQGVEQFNQQQFYACHDTLEALWMEAIGVDKPFYQGILQIAVALYHLENCNWRGAVILLGEGMNRLQPYRPDYAGLNIDQFLIDSTEVLQLLHTTGAEAVETIAQQLKDGSGPTPEITTTLKFPTLQKI